MHEIWRQMRGRCLNPLNKAYARYGGRSITIEWKDFDSFFNDMYPTYGADLTIDRINNDGNYSKENCRWATRMEQANNRSTNTFIEYKGESHTVEEWARILGISSSTFRQRLYVYKWELKKIMTTPTGKWSRRTI